jgi:hypothetical protein
LASKTFLFVGRKLPVLYPHTHKHFVIGSNGTHYVQPKNSKEILGVNSHMKNGLKKIQRKENMWQNISSDLLNIWSKKEAQNWHILIIFANLKGFKLKDIFCDTFHNVCGTQFEKHFPRVYLL